MEDVAGAADKQSRLAPIRLGIVGIGKIARDQHLPAIAASDRFVLSAAASRHAGVDEVPSFASIEEMLADGPGLDAVSICTPPDGRDAIARVAIAAGKHVMLEKPPGAAVSEVVALERLALEAGVTLFASWHSREAAAVATARRWLADREVRGGSIAWREDIRQWHPGQEWILAAGGFGVFDPGINALSIATAILPGDLAVRKASLTIPAGRHAPIAAEVALELGDGVPVAMSLDFLEPGTQVWEIALDTDRGELMLAEGGRALTIDGEAMPLPEHRGEYPQLYDRFSDLIRDHASDVDMRPLQLAADAFLRAEMVAGAPFEF